MIETVVSEIDFTPIHERIPCYIDANILPCCCSLVQQGQDVVPAASSITIRHLMSHSAGLTQDFPEPESVIGRAYAARELRNPQATLADSTEQMAELPLCFHPGTSRRYSFAADVIARLIDVASGQRFDSFLQEHIVQPLGMLQCRVVGSLHRGLTELE